MKKLLLTFVMTAAGLAGFAQVQEHRCATDEVYLEMVNQDPAILQRQELFDQQAMAKRAEINKKTGTIRIIPVVFHVFHKAGTDNISDAQILNEVALLNQNFRRTGPKSTQTRAIFTGVAGDMEIEFRLARKDPNGNCTNGIVRIYDEETENGTNNLKLKSVWPTDRYLNVWVVESIVNYSNLPGIAGYAQFPWAGSYNTDGVIILSDQIGEIGTSNPGNATTVTHEIGHWLGCFHPFQDSCMGGDKVDDTPPCADNRNTILSCDYNRNTCANDIPTDMPDQIENYMDYTVGTCQNMFTIGQKARMDAALENWRPYLYSIKNLVETGTDVATTPATCAPIADFFSLDNQRSRSQFACQSGASIDFRDNSYNYSGTITRQWTFEGGTPTTSSAQNPSVSYAQPGKYDVTLIVSNANGSDTMVMEDYIEVVPTTAPIKAPYFQDFEFPAFPTDGWFTNSTTFTDYRISDVGQGTVIGGNSRTLQAPNGNGIAGSRFDLYSPSVDLSGVSSPVLSFWYAFAQRVGNNGLTNDGFRVYYSTDCGQNWLQLWARSGAQLSTVGALTPTSTLAFVPSDRSKWRQVIVNIPGAITPAQRQNIRFRFQFVSNGGNNFYIDLINFGFPASIEDDFYSADENFNVYPNPTKGNATVGINLIADSDLTVTVQDILGREVATLANGKFIQGAHEFNFDTKDANLGNGLYFVKMTVNGHVFTKKLMYTE